MAARKFSNDYGVFVCEHVFNKDAPVTFAVRDFDGSYQFLCGQNDDEVEPHLVCISHLLTDDPSLAETADLEPGSYADRDHVNAAWSVGSLNDIASPE